MKIRCRVGLIGAGNRAKLFYGPILSTMKDEFEFIGVTSRTEKSRVAFANEFNTKSFDSIDDLHTEGVDFVICCVNPQAVYDIVSKCVDLGLPVMIETPVDEERLVALSQQPNAKVSVSEQWPHLPLEKFKKKVIESGVLGEIYLVENDSRLFDYHGIAILRNYLKDAHPVPITITAMNHVTQIPGLADEDSIFDSWDIGIAKMSSGETLIHKFSYPCKKYDHRGMQSVRAIGQLGCIVNSCIDVKNNDFENIHIGANINGETQHLKVEVERDSDLSITHKIECSSSEYEIVWKNDLNEKYDKNFDDHTFAIASLLLSMKEATSKQEFVPPYPVFDGYIDALIIFAMKNAAASNSIIKFNKG